MSRANRLAAALVALVAASALDVTVAAADEPPRQDDAAAEESDDGIDIGGYGGLGLRYARLLDRNSVLLCLELALLFEQRLSIGTGACSTWMSADGATDASEADGIMLEFGGTIVRYHLFPTDPISLSFGTAVGVGQIDLERDGEVWRTDSIIVVEPEVGAHTMVTDWMRLSAVGAYRIVSGVDTGGVTSGDVSGFSTGINAHFGWF
ncbi:MAG: hypothetical protein ACOC1F_05725 [Myxococcota bacterium]